MSLLSGLWAIILPCEYCNQVGFTRRSGWTDFSYSAYMNWSIAMYGGIVILAIVYFAVYVYRWVEGLSEPPADEAGDVSERTTESKTAES